MIAPGLKTVFFLSALFLVAFPVHAETIVFEHKGSSSRTTPDFEVRAPWILDWRVSTEGAYESAVDISLEQAGTGIHQGQVLTTKYPGNGVRLFDASGKFYFRINSSFASWTLKVIELSEAEAAEYTPRDRSLLKP